MSGETNTDIFSPSSNSNIPFLSSSPNNESNISLFSSSSNDNASKLGPKKKPVWQHFDTVGNKIDGHQGCKCKYCRWTQKIGKPSLMEAHLALKCLSVPKETKNIFLHIISNRDSMDISSSSSSQQKKKQKHDIHVDKGKKIKDFYRPTSIDPETIKYANRAIVKFFVCCGIPFLAVNHPFFRDFIHILHPGYVPPQRTELSQNLLDGELARVLLNTDQELKHEENLTLGRFNIFNF
jgi:hypothetical protein